MKKNVLYIVIAVLVVMQMVSLAKINNLQNQLNNVKSEIYNQGNNTKNEINAIYSNVDEMLKREVSLIEIASTELGTLDISSLTVPITYSITPKEVSENTAVSLEFDGELIPMNKNGTTFTTTVSHDIFGNASPMILIDEDGVKKTTQDDRIMVWSIRGIKDSLLPTMHPRLSGEARYGDSSYKRKGTLNADFKNVGSGIVFTEMRFVIKVDDEVFSDEIIFTDTVPVIWDWQVDKTIPLTDGQTCIMTIIAVDSIGLEHHYTVDHYLGGANNQREPWFDDEQIYSADGELLWETENPYSTWRR